MELQKESKIADCVITLGKFDGVHLGHQFLLGRAKQIARQKQLKFYVFTFDTNQSGAMIGREEKQALLMAAGADGVYFAALNDAFKAMSARQFFYDILLKKFHARYVVAGADWRFGHNREGDVHLLAALAKESGIGVEIVDKIKVAGEIVSSTNIRGYIAQGEMEKANQMLGRAYTIASTVLHGKMLGRTLGFPTINFQFEKGMLLPKRGVYITKTGGHPSMTNIGINPTVEQGSAVKAETHILDFDKDLYGQVVQVAFLRKIREEIQFSNLSDLTMQLQADCAAVRKYFQ